MDIQIPPELKEHALRVKELIDQHGSAILSVGENHYSVGLGIKGFPDIVINCPDHLQQVAHTVINAVIAKWNKDGYQTGLVEKAITLPLKIVELDYEATIGIIGRGHLALNAFISSELPSDNLKLVQVFVPDQSGKFPESEGYDFVKQLAHPESASKFEYENTKLVITSEGKYGTFM